MKYMSILNQRFPRDKFDSTRIALISRRLNQMMMFLLWDKIELHLYRLTLHYQILFLHCLRMRTMRNFSYKLTLTLELLCSNIFLEDQGDEISKLQIYFTFLLPSLRIVKAFQLKDYEMRQRRLGFLRLFNYILSLIVQYCKIWMNLIRLNLVFDRRE